jgi:lipopolysaccharide export LptBFGC system permease protein LptF
MLKPFTTLAALLFLLGAVLHAYRIYSGFAVIVAGHTIPMWGSWIGVAVAALLGVMLLVESRR